MNNHQPVMTIFAGTNGAGKSTISLQMRELTGEVVDPDQMAMRLNPENPRSADLSARKQSNESIADQLIIIDNTFEPTIIAEIQDNQLIYKMDQIPEWSKSVLDLFRIG
ncbi:hypothetical protein [Paenibacillus macerans]|uniref:hypothetical protein n=1 Tax=Paenibacillus macerans TaxID=44252 RepID=UPI003D31CED3